ncbi:hypothetical protein IH992_12170 [Candidatus Poribacteria bacterium]|nr:hypothetical protein [Candidatus Poribacteria bacterium]
MIETNIRIVGPGTNLYLFTRCAKNTTQDHSPKFLEQVCKKLQYQELAAVYCPIRQKILVLTRGPIPPVTVKGENWIVEVKDANEDQRIDFSASENDAELLAQLIERRVLIEIKHRLKMRTIDSPRIWYENTLFRIDKGIAAYRRFEVSAIPIEGVGVGISVDVGVAFFTQWTVAEFFRNDIPRREQERRQEQFESLSQRQQGQKGTLLYDLDKTLNKCYFDEFRSGVTCATTGKRIVKRQEYRSLLEYYQQNQPHLKIYANDRVAMVSFRGIDHPQPVAAKLLCLRVMNDSLPKPLKQVDKIPPKQRAKLIDDFWQHLGSDLLGHRKLQVARYFWHPQGEKVIHLKPEALQFADEYSLPAPQNRTEAEFREHYRQRLPRLRKVGCLDVPFLMERVVHFAIPNKATEEMRSRLIVDVTKHLSQLTKKPITPELVPYTSLDEVFSKLNRQKKPGIIVFVFEDEAPENYYKVAYELSDWRVKRITFRELESKLTHLQSPENSNNDQLSKAERDWNSFIEMTVLDVLQQMDCILWGFKDEPYYDAHLAIDVGRDRRHFALSLLILRPSLRIYTVVKQKLNTKRETINETVLCEEIVRLSQQAAKWKHFQRLRSLLILRDGRECGDELKGINKAKEELIAKKLLEKEAEVDVVDFHKSIKKGTRLWERTRENEVEQVLEGKALPLNNRTVVLATTGAPTLRQGTAAPVMLVAQSDDIDMVHVTFAVYASTHLNFSSPNVAQRLPLELKRTDDELKSRASQEIRRIR